MEQWLRANQATIPNSNVGLSAITSARNNMRWGTERASIIIRAARGSAEKVLPTLILLLPALFSLLLK